jgi:hypothetical protein
MIPTAETEVLEDGGGGRSTTNLNIDWPGTEHEAAR